MRHSFFVVPFVFAAVLSGAACSSPSTQSPSTESTGNVSAQLSTVGPDGATYSLTAPTSLIFSSTVLTNGYCEPLVATATEQWSLPPGAYTAKLYPTQVCQAADAGAPWTLTRSADGGTSTVSALLVTNPVSFTVTAGATTQFAFSFSIPQLGVLTFGTGTAVAGIQADAAAPSRPGSLVLSGTSMTLAGTTGTNAAVNTALATPTSIAIPYAFNVAITGSFAPVIDAVCAPVSLVGATASTTNTAYAALVQELIGATGNVCFADPNARVFVPNEVSLVLARTGTPTTSVFQSALGATTTATFGITEVLFSPAPLYSGTALTLGAYYQPITLTPNTWGPTIVQAGSYLANTNGNGNGSSATMTFAP